VVGKHHEDCFGILSGCFAGKIYAVGAAVCALPAALSKNSLKACDFAVRSPNDMREIRHVLFIGRFRASQKLPQTTSLSPCAIYSVGSNVGNSS
jgi:hypothetical protein